MNFPNFRWCRTTTMACLLIILKSFPVIAAWYLLASRTNGCCLDENHVKLFIIASNPVSPLNQNRHKTSIKTSDNLSLSNSFPFETTKKIHVKYHTERISDFNTIKLICYCSHCIRFLSKFLEFPILSQTNTLSH